MYHNQVGFYYYSNKIESNINNKLVVVGVEKQVGPSKDALIWRHIIISVCMKSTEDKLIFKSRSTLT